VKTHRLDAAVVHYEWNNALPPRLVVEPGDTVTFDTRDAADGYYSASSTSADAEARGPFRGHPLTGPVRVEGARPGDVLVVEILEVTRRRSCRSGTSPTAAARAWARASRCRSRPFPA
jgi:acetamidase/formamidase